MWAPAIMWATRSTRAPGRTARRKASSLRHAAAVALGDVEDGAVVLGDQPSLVDRPAVGQVAVLVEDGRQLADPVVEVQAVEAGPARGHALRAPAGERLVHQLGSASSMNPSSWLVSSP